MTTNLNFHNSLEYDNLTVRDLEQLIIMKKREEILQLHHNPVKYEKQRNRYYTFVIDRTSKSGAKKITARTTTDLNDKLIEYYSHSSCFVTFEMCYKAWLEHCESKCLKQSTIERYKRTYKQFFADLDIADKTLNEITEQSLVESISRCVFGRKRITQNAYKKLWEVLGGIIDTAAADYDIFISREKLHSKLRVRLSKNSFLKTADDNKSDEDKIFSSEEIEKLILFCKQSNSLVDFGIILALKTGLRVGELSALEKTDVLLEKRNYLLHIHQTETESTYNGKRIFIIGESPKTDAGNRKVVIPDSISDIVKKTIIASNPSSKYLFSGNTLERYSSSKFQRRLYLICKKLGIKNKSFVDIRHTYASILSEHNLSEKIITTSMGHKDINITKKYYIKSCEDISEKIDKINQVL